MNWSQQTTNTEAYRRAGGRRRYNAQRQMLAIARRRKVLKLAMAGHRKAEIARRLGVHRSTISRDFEQDVILAVVDTIESTKRVANRLRS